jgi:DNA modification methylase
MTLLVRADARRLPIADNSVDLVVTSPPFLNLRSYQDGGQHYSGQIGVGTREQFLEDLWEATAEMARVLKPMGSIFVELGDSYTDKCLNLTPHRYAAGCIDRLGLYLRAEIIWNRPNGLPESVTDRVRRAHSVWFHLTKQPRYFSAVDEIREPQDTIGEKHGSSKGYRALSLGFTDQPRELNPLGKLPGSVWTIPTQPLTVPPELGVDHFAAFPMEWPRRIIQAWSPAGVCVVCGEGRRPVTLSLATGKTEDNSTWTEVNGHDRAEHLAGTFQRGVTRRITGYACACPEPTAPTRPSVILDPFGGTGTTALVAKALGRIGLSVDMSADYCRLAAWRTTDPGQLAAALEVEKPEPVSPDQLDLFSEVLP